MSTHSVAIMPVSNAAFEEIKRRLKDADYGSHIANDGRFINMHGIGLEVEPLQFPAPESIIPSEEDSIFRNIPLVHFLQRHNWYDFALTLYRTSAITELQFYLTLIRTVRFSTQEAELEIMERKIEYGFGSGTQEAAGKETERGNGRECAAGKID